MNRIGENNPSFRHGHARKGRPTAEYKAWQNMIDRCYSEKNIGFRNYGGRGIRVCKSWRESFCNFLKDVGLKPHPELTLDRKNTNGNYFPKNCRWADRVMQRRNRRDSQFYELNGEKKTLSEWASLYRISYDVAWDRIHKLGWILQDALSTPVRPLRR